MPTTLEKKPLFKTKRISKSKAREIIESLGGKFFSLEFTKKNGEVRMMNCQYLANQKDAKLGYIKVKELSKVKAGNQRVIRNVNMQTIISLRTGGIIYKVK